MSIIIIYNVNNIIFIFLDGLWWRQFLLEVGNSSKYFIIILISTKNYIIKTLYILNVIIGSICWWFKIVSKRKNEWFCSSNIIRLCNIARYIVSLSINYAMYRWCRQTTTISLCYLRYKCHDYNSKIYIMQLNFQNVW